MGNDGTLITQYGGTVLPEGAPEQVVRTVTENSRVLKFESFGFEEE